MKKITLESILIFGNLRLASGSLLSCVFFNHRACVLVLS
jgi:hypothetical protein